MAKKSIQEFSDYLDDKSAIISAAAIPNIRRMLLIGMHAHHEAIRVRENWDATPEPNLSEDEFKLLRPILVSLEHEGAAFAEALMWLENARILDVKPYEVLPLDTDNA